MVSINKKKLADSVIEEIKRMINNGELREGDKLPNQNEFAAQLGVSRTSLREALSTLTLIGVIEQRPGFGTVIRSRAPALYANHLTPPLMSDEKATTELIEARRYIEMGGAELAAAYATAEEIEELKTLVNTMAEANREGRIGDYIEKDLAFHFMIAKASHNRFILHLFVTIRGMMEQYMRESFHLLPWMLERSLKFHTNIFQAIQNRDPARAVSEMRKHNLDILDKLKSYYTSTQKGLTERNSA
jgi:GntR family transcriptional regulator, transcriptional repressor for pyruvate dehydrogenase complex